MTHSRSTYIASIALWHWIHFSHRPSQSNKEDGISQPQAKTLMSTIEETFYVQISVLRILWSHILTIEPITVSGVGIWVRLRYIVIAHPMCVCMAIVWVWVLVYV